MKIISQKRQKLKRTKKIMKNKQNKKQHGGRTQKNKSNKLKKLQCSPKDKNKINKFSCYTDETLIKLRDLWNERHPDNLIKTNNTQEIHKKLANNLSNVCNKESCWLKQKFTDHKLDDQFSDSFAPESPDEWKKNPNEWLTSTDIINVMKQYENAYKCFDFIGPSPIDFDTKKMFGECVWDELCNFNLAEQIKNGKTKIGMIFNTHPHTKPGEHWLSMFINIKKGKIFFFDSVGNQIPKQIMALVNRIVEQGNNLNPKINFIFDQNYPVEHQYENTECGIYSLYFIIHMLEDKITEHYLKTHILRDEYIEKFRKIYFNDEL